MTNDSPTKKPAKPGWMKGSPTGGLSGFFNPNPGAQRDDGFQVGTGTGTDADAAPGEFRVGNGGK